MTKRFLVLIAAIGLLAACETAPKDAGDAAGASGAAPRRGQAGPSAGARMMWKS